MFLQFKKKLQKHVAEMLQNQQFLFVTDTDNDEIWRIYLESFPPGSNEIFRERREHDCSCCRHFVKSFGNVVIIKDNKLISIWDFDANTATYQPVINALAIYVKTKLIKDVFITNESKFGVDFNYERKENKDVQMWHHFRIELPKQFIAAKNDTIDTQKGRLRDARNVFKRSLEEISKEAIETILDLIAQKSLYKGEEWQNVLIKFLELHDKYHSLPDDEKDNFCWIESLNAGESIARIRNHSIGVLLIDITNEMDLNEAVKRYEKIVAPTNYKRPKAIFTKKMIEQAQKTLEELGLVDSLKRRYATIDDITVNNILFANKDTMKQMNNDVFDELKQDAVINPKKFDKVDSVPIETFIKDILPRTTNIELYLDNNHAPNFVSVIAPGIKDTKTMFKWNNNFSWAYTGNITDSMKERVKAAGGKVDGVLRFSIQWNDDKYNPNDFDAHCTEPNGNHIWFQRKMPYIHPSTGRLDVDIISPEKDIISVENITWTALNKMQEGRYKFFVHNYTHRGGHDGFKAEIEYDGQIYLYEYNKELRQDENITVAEIEFSRVNGIKFIKSLDSSVSSKTVWNLQTNQFHPVSVCMFSPNYWNEQKGIGHKHYFFILKNCKNEDRPNGFFNEFLKQDLLTHKRVFEALGSKMRVEQSDNQLSGLGFSSTKKNSVICKLEGHVSRVLKITF
jgi:hypothetical protein